MVIRLKMMCYARKMNGIRINYKEISMTIYRYVVCMLKQVLQHLHDQLESFFFVIAIRKDDDKEVFNYLIYFFFCYTMPSLCYLKLVLLRLFQILLRKREFLVLTYKITLYPCHFACSE